MVVRDSRKVCGNVGCSHQGHPLRKYRDQTGIELDTCPACGIVVFDAGELQELLAYSNVVQQSVVARTPAPSYNSWSSRRPAQTVIVEDNYGFGGGGIFGNAFGQDEIIIEPDGDVIEVDRGLFGTTVTEYDNNSYY